MKNFTTCTAIETYTQINMVKLKVTTNFSSVSWIFHTAPTLTKTIMK